jgi:hypothetical protein
VSEDSVLPIGRKIFIVANEIRELGARVSYKPLIAREVVELARSLVEVLH